VAELIGIGYECIIVVKWSVLSACK